MSVRVQRETLACGRGPAILSRTGYTGEDGFEVIAPADMIAHLWDQLTEEGAVPCGLAARDILRLEMGYLLNGQDMTTDITPIQAGLSWIVSFNKPERFIGREALEREKQHGPQHQLVGIVLEDKGIPRHDCGVYCGDQQVGRVTSGTLSPRLGKGIALGYVRSNVARERPEITVEIRSRRMAARIVDTPFYHPPKPAR
jgi:aminomethyltransferase